MAISRIKINPTALTPVQSYLLFLLLKNKFIEDIFHVPKGQHDIVLSKKEVKHLKSLDPNYEPEDDNFGSISIDLTHDIIKTLRNNAERFNDFDFVVIQPIEDVILTEEKDYDGETTNKIVVENINDPLNRRAFYRSIDKQKVPIRIPGWVSMISEPLSEEQKTLLINELSYGPNSNTILAHLKAGKMFVGCGTLFVCREPDFVVYVENNVLVKQLITQPKYFQDIDDEFERTNLFSYLKIRHPTFQSTSNDRYLDESLKDYHAFIAMKNLSNEKTQSLREFLDADNLDSKNVSIDERIDIHLELLYALEELHKKGIIHGDIKPDNILIKIGKKGFKIKFIDFEPNAYGTIMYREQKRLRKPPTHADDRYAIAHVLMELWHDSTIFDFIQKSLQPGQFSPPSVGDDIFPDIKLPEESSNPKKTKKAPDSIDFSTLPTVQQTKLWNNLNNLKGLNAHSSQEKKRDEDKILPCEISNLEYIKLERLKDKLGLNGDLISDDDLTIVDDDRRKLNDIDLAFNLGRALRKQTTKPSYQDLRKALDLLTSKGDTKEMIAVFLAFSGIKVLEDCKTEDDINIKLKTLIETLNEHITNIEYLRKSIQNLINLVKNTLTKQHPTLQTELERLLQDLDLLFEEYRHIGAGIDDIANYNHKLEKGMMIVLNKFIHIQNRLLVDNQPSQLDKQGSVTANILKVNDANTRCKLKILNFTPSDQLVSILNELKIHSDGNDSPLKHEDDSLLKQLKYDLKLALHNYIFSTYGTGIRAGSGRRLNDMTRIVNLIKEENSVDDLIRKLKNDINKNIKGNFGMSNFFSGSNLRSEILKVLKVYEKHSDFLKHQKQPKKMSQGI